MKELVQLSQAISKYITDYNVSRPVKSLCHRLQRYFANVYLQDLSPAIVEEYRISRMAEATPATVNRELAIIKRVVNLSVTWGWIDHNPIACVSYCKEAAKRDRWLTLDEELRLQKFAPNWLWDIIVIALNTGLRRGELLALKWENIHLDRRYIYIERSKNGDRRSIPMNDRVYEIFSHLRRNHSELWKGISPSSLEYYFSKTVKKAGLDDLHFHDLRHTFATRLIQKGVDLYRVQLLLGHRSPVMTQRYAHHSLETLRQAVEIL